ncbi:MAG: hypothetical protein ABIO94_13970 [Opitutaceae bacterium]
MSAKFLGRMISAVGIAAILGFALHQWTANEALRAEARQLRAQHLEIESLRAEQLGLKRQQRPSEEIAALKESAAEASRLRVEAVQLRRQVQEAEKADQNTSPANAPQPAAEFAINAGRSTPLAAVQTAVWAAKQGDTNALAGLIAFDAAGRALVDALFTRLPEETRTSNGSAEKVFATLLAVRLPQDLSSADLTTTMTPTGDEFTLGMRLKRTGGETKETSLASAGMPKAGGSSCQRRSLKTTSPR